MWWVTLSHIDLLKPLKTVLIFQRILKSPVSNRTFLYGETSSHQNTLDNMRTVAIPSRQLLLLRRKSEAAFTQRPNEEAALLPANVINYQDISGSELPALFIGPVTALNSDQ